MIENSEPDSAEILLHLAVVGIGIFLGLWLSFRTVWAIERIATALEAGAKIAAKEKP